MLIGGRHVMASICTSVIFILAIVIAEVYTFSKVVNSYCFVTSATDTSLFRR